MRLGLIGSGFMGRTHALAYRGVGAVFGPAFAVDLAIVADVSAERAAEAAAELGFSRSTSDWRALVADPLIDIVAITAPNALHKEMALAALAAGKAVHCEKPLAPSAADALAMAEAASRAGAATQVGFNYLKNPIIALARAIIKAGEIGEVVSFRGLHAEDYMADPTTPWSWRLDPAGGGGAIADLGSHVVALARHLLGPIEAVCGTLRTVIPERPARLGAPERRPVEVDDVAHVLLRFASGATGTMEANWVARGRTMQLAFEVTGTTGALAFTQERLNELRLYRAGDPPGRAGFRTLVAGPEHPPYGAFCVAPGHQLGFNDLKVIEARDFLRAVRGEPAPGPDFGEGWEVQRVIDAAIRSAAERGWVSVA